MESAIKLPLEAKKKYLLRRKEELVQIERMKAQIDWDFVVQVGHQIKGNAKTFEFPSLVPLAVSLEEAGRNQDASSLAQICTELQNLMGALEPSLTSSFE
ncbi:MAG: hypothetical protein OM95_16055 [Bdellovibrio sp. ArHS]|uniref:Hpt domain-containing protein n=1 Tax=Bdellovibrio sp. ArHS TaxID=1569284 RepID=UPI0005824AF2|nr:Hpt domain-containing protein [Bdellovibrio sp. ArHS]KHD87139.1 MAG: hypothetical protein OM95_16055 [Bdellovibrio sp. ArHS]